jgi:hypothetical protein
MTVPAPGASSRPPAWAEALLRALVGPRNRDTISGDLLEEYCEVVLPQRGGLSARLWYLRQVASFITTAGLAHAATAWLKEDAVFEKSARTPWSWGMAGSAAVLVLLGGFVQSSFRPPVGLGVFVLVAIALAAGSLMSMRSRSDVRVLWRIGLAGGLLVAIVLVTRLLFDVFAPVDPLDRFLARVRDDYSEFNYPRRWMPALAVTVILMGGGLVAAWRTGRVGMGTLGAVMASAIGSVLYVVLVAIGNLLPFGPSDPLGNPPPDLQFLGNVPMMLIPVLVMFSTVLGTIGALFGRALNSARPARFHG